MKILVLTLSLVVLSACHLIQKEIPLTDLREDSNCYHNGTLTAKERLNEQPFKKAEKIVVISFSSAIHDKTPLLNDTICKSKINEYIQLSNEQIDQLTDILYNYNYSLEPVIGKISQAGCYYPRHSIVFLDKSEKVIAYLEICLECKGIKSNIPEEQFGVFCDGKYELIQNFFNSIGIAYFHE